MMTLNLWPFKDAVLTYVKVQDSNDAILYLEFPQITGE